MMNLSIHLTVKGTKEKEKNIKNSLKVIFPQ